LNVRLPHVERGYAAAQPDVLALQETKLEDTMFSTISAHTPLVGRQHDIAGLDDSHEASACFE
jgi:exonuclease III